MGDRSRFSSPYCERSRQLRRNQTRAEKAAWGILRDRQTDGLKFRRQVPIDEYIVDFYCDEFRLIVELDGDVHLSAAQEERDMRRDQRLSELGYTVIRIPNGLAINDPERLKDMVRSLGASPGALITCFELAGSHSLRSWRHPLPMGEGQ